MDPDPTIIAHPEECPILWCDGALQPSGDLRVSPMDSGFTLGCGVFETMLARQGVVRAIERHWRRLARSAALFGITVPSEGELRDACMQVLRANALQSTRARLRVTVSAGEAPMGATLVSGRRTVVLAAAAAPDHAEPARLALVPWTRDATAPLSGVKSTSYAGNVMALAAARAAGADEAVFLNTRGHLCEGATSNLWFVHDGVLHSPADDSGCLPGVMREILLELCQGEGIAVEHAPRGPDCLAAASEAFLSSSLRGVQAVRSFGVVSFPDCPGPWTRRLARLLDSQFPG